MAVKQVLLAWSGGKDAAWTLHKLQNTPDVRVIGLLTTLDANTQRVAMHDTPRVLLQAQADAADLPLLVVPIPWPCPNAAYEAALSSALHTAQSQWNITHVAYGDLFLADIRAYREAQFEDTDLGLLFPLWDVPTPILARQMIAGGLRATLVCVDSSRLPAAFAGRAFDAALLDALPPGIDACGENGEFHTFVHDGPMFARPVAVKAGDVTTRDGFVFTDLRPAGV